MILKSRVTESMRRWYLFIAVFYTVLFLLSPGIQPEPESQLSSSISLSQKLSPFGCAAADQNYYVTMEIIIDFETSDSGTLSVYFGTLPSADMPEVAPSDIDMKYITDKVFSWLWVRFFQDTDPENLSVDQQNTLFQRVLSTSKIPVIEDFQLTLYRSQKDAGVGLDCHFEIFDQGEKTEYEFLDIIDKCRH